MDKKSYYRNFDALKEAYDEADCDGIEFQVVAIENLSGRERFAGYSINIMLILPGITEFRPSQYGMIVVKFLSPEGHDAGLVMLDLYELEDEWDGDGEIPEEYTAQCDEMRAKIDRFKKETILLNIAKLTEEWIAENLGPT